MSWHEASSSISFPSLGIEINPPEGFSIGSLNIQFYGIIIAVGLLLAVIYGLKRGAQFGLREDDILDGVLGIVPFAVICARAYYCIFSWDQFADNPVEVLYIWKGGLAIYGGVIGAVLGVIVFCLIKKIRLGAVLDLVVLGFLIGQSVGRWGNFFNREAFGVETESFLRMGLMLSESGSKVSQVHYYHPTFLYESLWNATGFVILHFLSKRRQYDGQIALGYTVWYGLGRTLIEGMRTDSLYWGQFRVSQLLAAVSCFVAAIVLVILAFRKHDRSKLFVHVAAARAAAKDAAEATEEATPLAEEITSDAEETASEEETVSEEESNDTAQESQE